MKRGLLILATLLFISCGNDGGIADEIKIAFLADVHLHDIYASLDGADFDSAPRDSDGHQLLLRPMEEQLRSTRVYNENYFAFIAALDDIVNREVDYVVLPGDFSDDGQINNIVALRNILNNYRKEYGIKFFITTGNHDPVRPFTRESVAINFLDSLGAKQRFYSQSTDVAVSVSRDICHLGYEEIVNNLSDFGFMPQIDFIYWESPFSSYDYSSYNFEEALQQAHINNREYDVSRGFMVPDASYLVEPLEGLWLLAIDANAYPLNDNPTSDAKNPSNYNSPSSGYNTTFKYKKFLFEWILDVAERAKLMDKRLITFSHYPVVDFFDSASAEIIKLLGDGKMQLKRNPSSEVADLFADAGIKLHFAGHMHIDDIGVHDSRSGNRIVNVQVPSIAGYLPSYKLMTMRASECIIESVTLEDVPNFNRLFPIYAIEHEYLVNSGATNIWNSDVFEVKSYRDFMSYHLRELVRLRFIPNDWSELITDELLVMSGAELLEESGLHEGIDNWENYATFSLFDIIYDLYRLYGGGAAGAEDIGQQRLNSYDSMLNLMLEHEALTPTGELIVKIFRIIDLFTEESNHNRFIVDLDQCHKTH